MIALTTENGEALRYFGGTVGAAPVNVSWYKAHGFITDSTRNARRVVRLRGSTRARAHAEPLCRFRLEQGVPTAVSGCRVDRIDAKSWRLTTKEARFVLQPAADAPKAVIAEIEKAGGERAISMIASALIILVVLLGIRSALTPHEEEKKVADDQKTIVIPNVKTAQKKPEPPKVVEPKPEKKPESVAKVQKPKDPGAAVHQKLGFLALLGKKELTKAVGGMPTSAEHRSPGAGAGGTQGSGGQLLVGLGQGIKQTTVGNTGVAGLGGIGNAGAGGGEGGYGKSYVGSGGAGGSQKLTVALAKDVELDGGLDRAVIDATIAKYLSQVRSCYERGLASHPGLAGQVTIDFEINAGGKLSYSKVKSSSLDHPETENCIAHAMMAWQFPKPVGGTLVKVNYPFTLKPASYL